MTAPRRLRLSRERGFNLQEHSRAVNGLEAVNVARPSKWGNPYRVGIRLFATAAMAAEAFKDNLPSDLNLDELRGKNLACWCPLPEPGERDQCHAAVLLELANDPRPA